MAHREPNLKHPIEGAPPVERSGLQANYIYPTDRQFILALLNAIATHRDIKNPQIYKPVIVGGRIFPEDCEPVRIEKFRTFGGLELIEAHKLTLAVYPMSSRYANIKGYITAPMGDKSIRFEPYTLGSPTQAPTHKYAERAMFRVIVQLYYCDPDLDCPVGVTSYLHDYERTLYDVPHGRLVQYKDDLTDANEAEARLVREELARVNTLEVQVLPGEEILRDYISLLRGVLRDIHMVRPFAIRRPNILAVDYPSTNWVRDSENLVFHTAYIIAEYDLWEPPRHTDYTFPVVRKFDIEETYGPGFPPGQCG